MHRILQGGLVLALLANPLMLEAQQSGVPQAGAIRVSSPVSYTHLTLPTKA